MQRSFIITYKYPFFLNNFTSGKVRSFIGLLNLFSEADQRSLRINMIRRGKLSHELISKIIFLKIPSNSFLLVESVDCIVNYSYWQKLSSKWVVLPFAVSKDLQLESFEQS